MPGRHSEHLFPLAGIGYVTRNGHRAALFYRSRTSTRGAADRSVTRSGVHRIDVIHLLFVVDLDILLEVALLDGRDITAHAHHSAIFGSLARSFDVCRGRHRLRHTAHRHRLTDL